jgi:PAS domain S-box-containing protein
VYHGVHRSAPGFALADLLRIRDLLDPVPVGLYAKWADGTYALVNRWYREMLGVTGVDPIGHTDAELLPETLALELAAREAEVVRAGEPMGGFERQGERELFVQRVPLLGDGTEGLVGLVAPVPDAKAQAELLTLVLAADGRVLQVSRGLCDRLGLSEAAIVGRLLPGLLHAFDGAGAERLCLAMIAGAAKAADTELRFVDRNGRTVWMDASFAVGHDAQGRPNHLLLRCVDRTAQREIERLVDELRRGAAAPDQVVVVDDDEEVRTTAAKVIASLGYDVYATDEPAAALVRCRDHAVRLLVTDLLMPTMAGEELIRRVRVLRPRLSILCMSGFTPSRLGQRPDGLTTGWLQKPFAPAELVHAVRELLPMPIVRGAAYRRATMSE